MGMTRAEKVAEAARLRGEGLLLREIAERMGVAITTATAWLSDPDLSKQRERRERYSRPCPECGNPMDGSSGHNGAKVTTVCLDCHRTRYAERNERIFAAWERGDPPAEIAEREGLSYTAVVSLAVQYRRERGLRLRRRRNRELWPEIERLWREGLPGTEIAAELGISKENLYFQLQTMRKRGIDVPRRGRKRVAA